MDPLPHHYHARATASPTGDVALTDSGLSLIRSTSPTEFGGPGQRWSPETLLVAAVADCFILTFRSIAATSALSWQSLVCDAEGVLDRPERALRFTSVTIRARLEVVHAADADRARRLLEKAEQHCLVSNSLNVDRFLDAEVIASAAVA
jgi:peroxiredoxin-like protein